MTTTINNWQNFRIGICAILLTGILAEISRALIIPSVAKEKIIANTDKSVQLPTNISLPNWQLLNNQSLKPTTGKAIGHLYQYRNQNNEKVDIQVHYENYIEGNISRLLMIYDIAPPASTTLTIKHQENVGFYALTSFNNRAYLSACINPIGQSTATQEQFSQNKYQHGLDFSRILGWTAGLNDLIDTRCLWTVISTPLPVDADEQLLAKKHQTLEKIWGEWYSLWKPKLNQLAVNN